VLARDDDHLWFCAWERIFRERYRVAMPRP